MPFDLSEDQLKAAEVEIGATFPDSYRSRMMQSNGGEIDTGSDCWNMIPLKDTSDRKRLSRTTNHVLIETKSFSGFPLWPQSAIAIAENGTGNALVMLRNGDQLGPQVYYWYHDDGALELLAEDFSALSNDR